MERRLLLVARASLVDDMVGEEMETRMDDGEILLRQARCHDLLRCSAPGVLLTITYVHQSTSHHGIGTLEPTQA